MDQHRCERRSQCKTDTERRVAINTIGPVWEGNQVWLVLGAGIAVLLASRRSRSLLWRTVGPALGSSLLYRAASGREGLASLLRYLPVGKPGAR